MDISGDFPNGIKFYGSEGWIFVTRDVEVTASDPSGKRVKPATADGQRSQDSGERDRGQRDTSLPKRRPASELAGMHPQPPSADRSRGSGPSRLLHLPAAPHRNENQAPTALGPGARALS